MSAFTLSFLIREEFTRIFNYTLKVILVKSELIYKKENLSSVPQIFYFSTQLL